MFASSSVCSGKSLDSKIAFETAKTKFNELRQKKLLNEWYSGNLKLKKSKLYFR